MAAAKAEDSEIEKVESLAAVREKEEAGSEDSGAEGAPDSVDSEVVGEADGDRRD